MSIPQDTKTRLVESLLEGRLVIIAGAGLSIPPPSNLWPVVSVARHCFDNYHVTSLPPESREDIDVLSAHFYDAGSLLPQFIKKLVPWEELAGKPNAGHAAVGDFLLTRSVYAAITTNFDTLIEDWCKERKNPIRGALDGKEAAEYAETASPLLKIHGCMHIDRDHTLWAKQQLDDDPIEARIESSRQWMAQHLVGKDLLIVGYWTDWDYLNESLSEMLQIQTPTSITVIDYCETDALIEKAGTLWDILSGGDNFHHYNLSSEEALDDLRLAFSKAWVRALMAMAPQYFHDDPPASECPDLGSETLYDLRRDAEGIPYTRAATLKEPAQSAGLVAYMRELLMRAGATIDGSLVLHEGISYRIINGDSRPLNVVRNSYNEPPTTRQADRVICAGAVKIGLPGNIVRRTSGLSVVEATEGGSAEWLTHDELQESLGL